MGSRISQQAAEFSTQFSNVAQKAWNRVEQSGLQKWSGENATVAPGQLLPSNAKVMATARSAIMTIASVAGGVVLVVFLGFYVALTPDIYQKGLVRLFPPNARPRLRNVLQHDFRDSLVVDPRPVRGDGDYRRRLGCWPLGNWHSLADNAGSSCGAVEFRAESRASDRLGSAHSVWHCNKAAPRRSTSPAFILCFNSWRVTSSRL